MGKYEGILNAIKRKEQGQTKDYFVEREASFMGKVGNVKSGGNKVRSEETQNRFANRVSLSNPADILEFATGKGVRERQAEARKKHDAKMQELLQKVYSWKSENKNQANGNMSQYNALISDYNSKLIAEMREREQRQKKEETKAFPSLYGANAWNAKEVLSRAYNEKTEARKNALGNHSVGYTPKGEKIEALTYQPRLTTINPQPSAEQKKMAELKMTPPLWAQAQQIEAPSPARDAARTAKKSVKAGLYSLGETGAYMGAAAADYLYQRAEETRRREQELSRNMGEWLGANQGELGYVQEEEQAAQTKNPFYDYARSAWAQRSEQARQEALSYAQEKFGMGGAFANELIQVGVQMAPSVIAAMATGGASAVGQTPKIATSLGNLAEALSIPAYMTPTFIQQMGSSYDKSMQEGQEPQKAFLFSIVDAYANTLIEKGGVQTNLAENVTAKKGKDLVKEFFKENMLSEGMEEVKQNLASASLRRLAGLNRAPIYSKEDEDALLNPKRDAYAFGMGTLAGGFYGAAGNVRNKVFSVQTGAGETDAQMLQKKAGNQTNKRNLTSLWNADADSVLAANETAPTATAAGVKLGSFTDGISQSEENRNGNFNQNKKTGQAQQGAIRVGRATTIYHPYEGTKPIQREGKERTQQIPNQFVETARRIVTQSIDKETGKVSRSQVKKAYEQMFDTKGGRYSVEVDGVQADGEPYVVTVNKSAVRKVISDPKLSVEKLAVFSDIKNVIANADYVGSGAFQQEGKKQKKTVRFDYFETPVKINGKEYIASFDVEVFPQGENNYRTHKVIEKMNLNSVSGTDADPLPAAAETAPTAAAVGVESGSSVDSISQNAENSNGNFNQNEKMGQADISAQQRAAYQLMDILTDRYGAIFRTFRGDSRKNGFFDRKSGVIYINENGEDPMIDTVAHEFLHLFKQIDPEGYRMLKEQVLENEWDLTRLHQYKSELLSAYDEMGIDYRSMTEEEINDMVREEAMSDLMSEVMRDHATIERIAMENRTLAQKIIDCLEKIINDIKQALSALGRTADREVQQLVKNFEDVKAIYQETLAQSRGNFENRSVQRDSGDMASPRFDIKKDKFGNQYWHVETGRDIFRGIADLKQLQKKAYEYILRGDKGEKVNEMIDGEPLTFTRIGAKEYVYGKQSRILSQKLNGKKYYSDKMRLAPSITDLIENAETTYTTPDHKNHKFAIDGFKNYRGRVRIDNVIFDYIVRVGTNGNTNMFYDINLEAGQTLPSVKDASGIQGPTSIDSISQNDNTVNQSIRKNIGNDTLEDRRYSFGGRKAAEADTGGLALAKRMRREGADRSEIFKKTGWFVGLDGKWRFEIDDSRAALRLGGVKKKTQKWLDTRAKEIMAEEPGLTRKQAEQEVLKYESPKITVKDILTHPTLFRQYPDLADISVQIRTDADGMQGRYLSGLDIITIKRGSAQEMKSALIHELQHAIQSREGFTRGSSPDMWEGSAQKRYDQYYNTAGEVEARLASERAEMTQVQRRNAYPLENAPGVVYAEDAPKASGMDFYLTKDNDGEPITVIKDMQGVFSGVPETEYTKIAANILRSKFKEQTLPVSEYDLAEVTKKSVGEYTHPRKRIDSNLYTAKMRASAELGNLLEGSEFLYHAKDTKNHSIAKDGWDYYRTRFVLDGQVFEGKINIAVSDKGRIFYDITDIKRVTDNYSKYSRPLLESTSVFGNSFDRSISQNDNAVNTSIRKNSGNDTKISQENIGEADGDGQSLSVSRKRISRKEAAEEALSRYRESGDKKDLPETTWARSYRRDAQNRVRYLDNQINEADYDLTYNAKTPEEKERLSKLIKELKEKEKEALENLGVAEEIRSVVEASSIPRNIDLVEIAPDLKDMDKGLSVIKNGNYEYVDVYRNFKRVFGKHFEQYAEPLLDEFDAAKGDSSRDLISRAADMHEIVVKKLGIRPGSKESAAVQWIAEGERNADMKRDREQLKAMGINTKGELAAGTKVPYTEEMLVKEFGAEKAENIKQAAEWFRKQYDELLENINTVIARIYPNNPDKLIRKRKDYMRHFREISSGPGGLKTIFDMDNNIDPKLVGISEYTKPKSKWASIKQVREGSETDEGAIEGFLEYLPQAMQAIYIDPFIERFRSLARDLAEIKSERGETNLNGFIDFLQKYAGSLAGKSRGIDRLLINALGSNGRTVIKGLAHFNNKTKANAVLGNVASVSKQVLNIPNGIQLLDNPAYIISGLFDTMRGAEIFSLTGGKEIHENYKYSNFLTERLMVEKTMRKFQKNGTGKGIEILLGAADEFGTRSIWNAAYREGLNRSTNGKDSITEADKKAAAVYADKLTRSAVGGRGIGEVPIAFQSQVGKLALPFQLEVSNTWNVLRDTLTTERKKGKLANAADRAVHLLLSYLAVWGLNSIVEALTGSKGAFDPIDDIFEGIRLGKKEKADGTLGEKLATGALRSVQNLGGDFIGNRTYGWVISEILSCVDEDWDENFFNGSVYPSQGVNIPALQSATKAARKGIEVGREVSEGSVWWKGFAAGSARFATEAATSFVTPYGGKQLDKTIRGLGDYMRGGNYQSDIYAELLTGERGNRRYKIEQSPVNALKAAAFGPGSLKEGNEYWAARKLETAAQREKKKQKAQAREEFITAYKKQRPDSEAVRLYGETKNKEVFPFEVLEREQDFKYKKVKHAFSLTDAELNQYQEQQNKLMQEKYDAAEKTDEYRKADADGKKEILKEARSEAQSEVKEQIKKDYIAKHHL